MKKNQRLTSYLNLLFSNDFVSAEEFSKIFNISIRTVFRDIKSIENLGIEIQVEPSKGYYILNGLPNFSKEEKEALIMVSKLLEDSFNKPLSKNFNNAINKILPFINIGL